MTCVPTGIVGTFEDAIVQNWPAPPEYAEHSYVMGMSPLRGVAAPAGPRAASDRIAAATTRSLRVECIRVPPFAGRSRQWLGAVPATGLGTVCQRLPRLSRSPYGRAETTNRTFHERNLKRGEAGTMTAARRHRPRASPWTSRDDHPASGLRPAPRVNSSEFAHESLSLRESNHGASASKDTCVGTAQADSTARAHAESEAA